MPKSARGVCWWLAVLLILTASVAQAQEAAAPALVVRVQERSQPLVITRVETQVRILGFLCETHTTMTFHNPNPLVLAGDLDFPLPQGATVSGYALDVGGRLVDGVVVEKDKGRQVFEQEVRQGVDPGLVEWVGGNNFRTRVFPIPAKGARTVMVRYLSHLALEAGAASYHLPLRFPQAVENFSLRVEVVKPSAPPQIKAGSLSNFNFARWQDSFVAETSLSGQPLNHDLVIALPEVARPRALVEKAPDGQYYFCLYDMPSAPAPAQAAQPPKRLTLLWDASASRASADLPRELGLLQAYLAKNQAGEIAVDLVLFRNQAEPARRFLVRGGDCQELLAALKAVDYDGGTSLGSLAPDSAAPAPDFYLLFSDGLSTFGPDQPQGFNAPLYAMSSQSTANHALLGQMAQTSGGQYFNLSVLPQEEVLAGLGQPPYAFQSLEAPEGAVAEVLPRPGQPLAGLFSLSGRLLADKATLTVHYGRKGGPSGQGGQAVFLLAKDQAGQGTLLALDWAQKKLDDLALAGRRHHQEMIRLGQEFGLVTPGTSLLVLENLGQYVRHRVAPPLSLPEMRGQYLQEVARLETRAQDKKRDKLDWVLGLWQKRVEWWSKDYPHAPGFKYEPPKPPAPGAGREQMERARMTGEAPSAMPSPPPMAATAPAPASSRLHMAKKAARGGGGAGDEAGQEQAPQAEISLKPWDPGAPYLAELRKAAPDQQYQTYLAQRQTHGKAAGFYLDCADFFFAQKQNDLGLRVLSNIAELRLEDPALLRTLAHRLAQQNLLVLARLTFEEVLRLRPEEPQSYRDLALVLARLQDYRRAVDLLYQVVTREWDRFREIELVALTELNRIIPLARQAGVEGLGIDPRLVQLMDVDVRVVLTWDTDMADMDLWVTEPSGEKCYYQHQLTTIGGHISRDITEGYGPEEYMVRKAMPGTYLIQANYYGSRSSYLRGPVTLQVDVYTNYGRPQEKRQSLTIRLKQAKDVITVGEVKF
jgi:tetratricopeptide (TPR) repeat protein